MLDFGSGAGHVSKFMDDEMARELVLADPSGHALHRDTKEERPHAIPTARVHLQDAESLLPAFAENSFDAVVSSLYLHWINDLPRVLREINTVLKPDGVLLGAMLGGETLYELRCSLQLAEQEISGGIAPRVSPMIQSRDLAGLLKQNNFVITTGTPWELAEMRYAVTQLQTPVDVDEITVNYPSPDALVRDLKAMGESNAIAKRLLGS